MTIDSDSQTLQNTIWTLGLDCHMVTALCIDNVSPCVYHFENNEMVPVAAH